MVDSNNLLTSKSFEGCVRSTKYLALYLSLARAQTSKEACVAFQSLRNDFIKLVVVGLKKVKSHKKEEGCYLFRM